MFTEPLFRGDLVSFISLEIFEQVAQVMLIV